MLVQTRLPITLGDHARVARNVAIERNVCPMTTIKYISTNRLVTNACFDYKGYVDTLAKSHVTNKPLGTLIQMYNGFNPKVLYATPLYVDCLPQVKCGV